MILFIIYFSLLGLIVGSFLNVAILRYNTGKSLGGRSGCFSCGHGLGWQEMIPVVSFLALGGRCRHCGSKISRQYPAVELLTAVLFGLSAAKFYPDLTSIVFYCLMMSLLVMIVVYDLKHKIIADEPVYIFGGLALLAPILTGWMTRDLVGMGKLVLWNLIGGMVIFSFFFSLWYFSNGRWMGFGDAKLGFGLGALLGLSGAVNAVVLAFWLGAGIGLILVGLSKMQKIKALRRRFSIKSEIPFAPFLVAGLLLNLFLNISIFVF